MLIDSHNVPLGHFKVLTSFACNTNYDFISHYNKSQTVKAEEEIPLWCCSPWVN